jgi:hypothetical protein
MFAPNRVEAREGPTVVDSRHTSDSHEAYDTVAEFRNRYPASKIVICWESGEVTEIES